MTARLQSGGTVTLTVSVDLLALSEEDRNWVFGAIDHVRGYARGAKAESPGVVAEAPTQ